MENDINDIKKQLFELECELTFMLDNNNDTIQYLKKSIVVLNRKLNRLNNKISELNDADSSDMDVINPLLPNSD